MYSTVSEERLEMRRHIASMRRLKTMEKERDTFINRIMKDHERMNKQLMKYRLQQVQRQLAMQVHHIFSEISVTSNTDDSMLKQHKNAKKSKVKKSKVEGESSEVAETNAFDLDDVHTQMERISDCGLESANRSHRNSMAYYSTSMTPRSADQKNRSTSIVPEKLTQRQSLCTVSNNTANACTNSIPTEILFSKNLQFGEKNGRTISGNVKRRDHSATKKTVSKPLFETITLRECWVGKPEAIGSVRRKLRSNEERQFQKHLENLLNSQKMQEPSNDFTVSSDNATFFRKSGKASPMVISRNRKGISIAMPSSALPTSESAANKDSVLVTDRRCKSAVGKSRNHFNVNGKNIVRPKTSLSLSG